MPLAVNCARPSTRLKRRLGERTAIPIPGAFNALSARIIADLGFEAVYVTGAGVTNSFLGLPDVGLITLTELGDHVAAIRDAVDLPLIVDADTGFGNAINARHAVRVLERAGANAIQLEDQVFPKRCGHFAGKAIVDGEEMTQKIRAAVDARVDPDLLIVARTDARAVHGFEAAIERAARYVEAGADVTFVEAPTSVDEIRAIPRRLPVPQVLNLVIGGATPILALDELRAAGFGMVLYANAALQGAIHGMQQALRELATAGVIDARATTVASFAERQRLVGKDDFDRLEKKYEVVDP